MKSNPLPQYIKEGVRDHSEDDVKMGTKSSLLREATIYRKKQEEEEKAQMNLEINGRDASDFHLWQQEMKEKDKQEKSLLIEKRKLEMQLAREYAIDAKEQSERENKRAVAKMKKEREEIENYKHRQKQEEEETKREIVVEFQQIRERVRDAMAEYAAKNKEKAAEVIREKEELQQRLAIEEVDGVSGGYSFLLGYV